MFDITQIPTRTRKRLEKDQILLSNNSKTGISINSRILPAKVKDGAVHRVVPASCRPTDWCKRNCYARSGRFVSWNKTEMHQLNRVQQAHLVNSYILRRFESAGEDVVSGEADRIVRAATDKGFNNIRWNGGGDLSKGAVRLINLITQRHPRFIVWGFSKRADLALGLEPRPNLRITMSMDPTTPPWGESGCSFDQLLEAASHLGGVLAYATELPEDSRIQEIVDRLRGNPGHVRLGVVFGFHRNTKHTHVGHKMECPATDPQIRATRKPPGCQQCRWCFMSKSEKKRKRIKSPREALNI